MVSRDVLYTYDEAGDGRIRALITEMSGLIVARRDDPLLLTDEGKRTKRLFELVMAMPGGITDVYTEPAGEEQKCCAVVVCWTRDDATEADQVGRTLSRVILKAIGFVRTNPRPFWIP